MSKPTYYELLKHPKWQKRRLEVLQRAGFECEACGTGEVMLHVHHSYYEKGLAPWEYLDESLHCLCEECHKKTQDRQTLLHRQIGKLDLSDVDLLLGYAMGLESRSFPMVALDAFSYEVAAGIADCWGLKAEEVIEAIVEGQIDGYKLDQLVKAKQVERRQGPPPRKPA